MFFLLAGDEGQLFSGVGVVFFGSSMASVDTSEIPG